MRSARLLSDEELSHNDMEKGVAGTTWSPLGYDQVAHLSCFYVVYCRPVVPFCNKGQALLIDF